MTFARGLRAILRQDPDVVMVGEIRDLETAEIAVQASLTGDLVMSTLHTNTAVGAVTAAARGADIPSLPRLRAIRVATAMIASPEAASRRRTRIATRVAVSAARRMTSTTTSRSDR